MVNLIAWNGSKFIYNYKNKYDLFILRDILDSWKENLVFVYILYSLRDL